MNIKNLLTSLVLSATIPAGLTLSNSTFAPKTFAMEISKSQESENEEPEMEIELDDEEPEMEIELDDEEPEMEIELDDEEPEMETELDNEEPEINIVQDNHTLNLNIIRHVLGMEQLIHYISFGNFGAARDYVRQNYNLIRENIDAALFNTIALEIARSGMNVSQDNLLINLIGKIVFFRNHI